MSTHGRRAVWTETSDGAQRLVPLRWTTLHPRADPLALNGAAVRLAPEALRELAAWVGARVPEADPHAIEKLAPEIGRGEERGDGEHSPRGVASAVAVVGQTRSPSTGRRGARRKRGT